MTKTYGVALLTLILGAGCGDVSPGGKAGGSGEALHVKQLAAGYPNFYGLLADGTVVRWSFDDDSLKPTPPSRVLGLEGVVDISGEFGTFCALLETGRVRCWGDGDYGQLGDGVSGDGHRSEVPVEVVGLTDAVDIAVSADANQACAVRKSGTVACWGWNPGTLGFESAPCGPYPRQLSDTEFVDEYHPCEASSREVEGVAGAVSVAVGVGYQCALDAAGVTTCWGAFRSFEGKLQLPVQPPTKVADLGPAKRISVGADHGCAIRADDSVACWGDNGYGQLGLGDGSGVSASDAAVAVPGLDHAAALTAQHSVTCAPRADGRITCWGLVGSIINLEDLGIHNDGHKVSDSVVASPVDLPQMTDATEVVFRHMSCFRRFDDSVRCWPNWRLALTFVDVTW